MRHSIFTNDIKQATMVKKTYGVSGLMDWVVQIPMGKSSVKVHFTGGALTTYGVTPAEYTTDNPFFQKVIEGSEYYKDGRIALLRADGEPEAPRAAEPQEAASDAPAQSDDTEKIEVTCLQDAREILAERYGIATSKVISWAAAEAIGAEHGIEFVKA